MGLQAIELAMRAEDHFGITIEDGEAEACTAVWSMYALICGKLGIEPEPPERLPCLHNDHKKRRERRVLGSPSTCPNVRIFNRLRRAPILTTGARRSSIRPETRVADLLPAEDAPKTWDRLRQAVGLPLPRLALPWRWDDVITATCALTFIGLAASGALVYWRTDWPWMAFAALAIAGTWGLSSALC